MNSGRSSTSSLVRAYVSRKVAELQGSFLARSSSARAQLARLRRLDAPGAGSWMSVGETVFADMPLDGLQDADAERFMRSAKLALKLYALHQQSKKKPMAVLFDKDAPWRGTLGSACFQAGHHHGDNTGAAGIERRMSSLEAATEWGAVEVCLRALVQLLRAQDVPLDYGRLAHDLYLLQIPEAKDGVHMSWARDYFAYRPTPEDVDKEQ